uniref:ORF163 n=1 Tax=Gronococcus sybilensis TaxID=3028029 RepID=A0A9Y1I2P2_9RHOD|nr:ORF163 [Gronococcus sybilensis]
MKSKKVLSPQNLADTIYVKGFLKELFQEIYALTRRLFVQLIRRPSTLIAGVVQPLLWLILFGALFQNAPVGIFSTTNSYVDFLAPGIIVFTAFGGALNAGLPIIFDREFGFFNRLLTAPLISRLSIMISSAILISTLSIVQASSIMYFSTIIGIESPNRIGIFLVTFIILLLTIGITSVSILLAFLAPGHVELLAVILLLNLPLLFSSTALAPLHFMPPWLQIVASLNPLTYAIEPIRCIYLNASSVGGEYTIENVWGALYLSSTKQILLVFDFCMLYLLNVVSKRKL